MIHLYKHQQKIISEAPLKCGLWLGTGSGKTLTALMCARGAILVIAPKTQVEDGNWEREYKKVLTEPLEKYKKGDVFPILKPNLTVISKETFRRDSHLLPRFNTIIVDEAHTCLGVMPSTRQRMRETIPKASQLFDALDAYIARTKPERLYLLTATIVKNPMTVWGARKLLGKLPQSTMRSFTLWRDMFYMRLPMPGREVWVPKSDEKTKQLLAHYVREIGYVGRLEDYFDVPEQTFRTVHIELTKKQQMRLRELPLEYPDPIVLIGKRHQVENGVLSGDEFNAPEFFDNGKTEKLIELAEEFPRMIVFVKYRAQIDALYSALTKEKKHVLMLTGDTKDRGKVIAAANASKAYIFLVQAQISAGWEVPECPTMVFASRTYSYVDYAQALGRVQRVNNIKKNLYINLVVKDGIDEAVDKCLANKQDFDEKLYSGI